MAAQLAHTLAALTLAAALGGCATSSLGAGSVKRSGSVPSLTTVRATPTGVVRAHPRRVPARPSGAGVTVYVIDSGIRSTHREFAGADAVQVHDFLADGRDGADCHGHGTHVAGIVGGSKSGIAPGIRLVALRVAGCDGRVDSHALVAALEFVVDHAAHAPAVMNYSITSALAITDPAIVDRLERAFERIVARGITVVAAAGNGGDDACQGTPAWLPLVITVSSAEERRWGGSATLDHWANHGRCVDILAPGARVRAASWRNDTDLGVASGTSMSAGVVSGAAALYLACRPRSSPADVAAALHAWAMDVRLDGRNGRATQRLLTRERVLAGARRSGC